MLRDLQERFHAALLAGDPAAAVESIVSDRIPAAYRFGVHINTFTSSLVQELESTYPVVRQLVGATFFHGSAVAFIRSHPPTVPQLWVYGADFPVFLDDFAPARSVPYLADVARLEWARCEAYFAADDGRLCPDALQSVAAVLYPALRFRLHPSVRLVRSRFPVLRIWTAHQGSAEVVRRVDPAAEGETALVMRTGADGKVSAGLVSAGDASLVAALQAGRSFLDAVALALSAEPGFDLQGALVGHLQRGTFSGLILPDPATGPGPDGGPGRHHRTDGPPDY